MLGFDLVEFDGHSVPCSMSRRPRPRQAAAEGDLLGVDVVLGDDVAGVARRWLEARHEDDAPGDEAVGDRVRDPVQVVEEDPVRVGAGGVDVNHNLNLARRWLAVELTTADSRRMARLSRGGALGGQGGVSASGLGLGPVDEPLGLPWRRGGTSWRLAECRTSWHGPSRSLPWAVGAVGRRFRAHGACAGQDLGQSCHGRGRAGVPAFALRVDIALYSASGISWPIAHRRRGHGRRTGLARAVGIFAGQLRPAKLLAE